MGCDERGPLPGVGGRGVWGGESRGAGIEVPSVSEKLIGASVNGLNLAGIVAVIGGVLLSSINADELASGSKQLRGGSGRERSANGAGSHTGVSSGRAGVEELDRVYGAVRERWFARHETTRRWPTAAQLIRAI